MYPRISTHFKYIDVHSSDKNTSNKGVLMHISNWPPERVIEMSPAMPQNSKMIFQWMFTCVEGHLQNAEISQFNRKILNHLSNYCKGIMSSNSSDIRYTKLIKLDIETYPKLPPVAPKPHTFPSKHHKWVKK